jgi:transposase-like protein
MPRPFLNPDREQFWRRHRDRHRTSGLTIADYCRRHGLAASSFHAWRRTLAARDRAPASLAPTPAFLPVAVVEAPASPRESPSHEPPIEIRLACGHRVRVRTGCDRALLADVLALLDGAPQPEARPC